MIHKKFFVIAVVVALVAAAGAQAGTVEIVRTDNGGVSDAQLNLAGSVTNDILLDSPGTSIFSQQMRLLLTAGNVLDHPAGNNAPPNNGLFGFLPALQYDTFAAAGGPDSSSPAPTFVGRSDELGGPGGVPAFFGSTEVDALWGPSLGQNTENQNNYLSARITLSGNATGTFSYRAVFGDTTELLMNVPITNGCIGTPEACGGTGGDDEIDPVITPLVENIMLPSTIMDLQLSATDNESPVSALVWSNLVYAGGPGKNPAFPSATDAMMDSDGLFDWNPGGWRAGAHTFNATVTDEAGNSATGLALTVNLTVPEPATLSMLGLALVGCVGLIRRRG